MIGVRLLVVAVALLQGCAATRVVVVPADDPYVQAYVSGRSTRAPDRLAARVEEAARRLGDQVEMLDRSAIVWQHRIRRTDYYAGIRKVDSTAVDLGEVATGDFGWLAVVYRDADRPPPLDTPWTRRQAAIDEACPDLRSTSACIRVRGTVRDHVRGSRDADRPAHCAAGLGSACMILAWEARRAGDQAGFLERMRDACEVHHWPEACVALGDRHAALPAAEAEQYRRRATALEEARCAAGLVKGCPDEEAHRRRRCEAGQLEFCRDLARRALPTATGPTRASLLDELQRYCDQGLSLACMDLARASTGRRSREHAARACLLGSRGGCELLDER